MNTPKWTPGPWRKAGGMASGYNVIGANNEVLATNLCSPDAHLIAAAPELFEALQLCAAVTDSFLNGQGAVTEAEMDAALSAANAAIAKAWGGKGNELESVRARNGVSPQPHGPRWRSHKRHVR